MSFDLLKDKNKKIHFIGVGGISMSGLAEILIERGFKVSGSDMKSSEIVNKLSKHGLEFYLGHNEENIKNADLVVYTAAISPDNPELIKAKALNIPLMDRAEFLGLLMKEHKYNIAISGTHGKTTTTSIFSHIMLKANLDPTILVGGELDIINGNVRTGNSDYFITEACEYKASFLKFFPYIGVILNIDADHLDFYRDINQIQDTFNEFANLIPIDGYLVAYAEDSRIKQIISNIKCNIITYGFTEGNITAKNISFNEKGCATFDAYKNDKKLFTINLNVPGKHNILNALASICCALCLNVSSDAIIGGISSFYGTHRRFELKGKKNGITVIDDYAHHPTEIKATLNSAKVYPHKKIYCVFQPHTYSRTLTLFDDFANSFFDTDELIIADIYAAREKDLHIVSSDMLGDAITKKGVSCKNFHNFEDITEYLKANATSGDLILTVGAGDIYKVGEMFLK